MLCYEIIFFFAIFKAAQEMIRKQLSALNGYTDFVDDDDERNIKESVNRIFKRLNKSEEDCQVGYFSWELGKLCCNSTEFLTK